MQMAFFKAVGKFIDSSGLIDILVSAEAGVLKIIVSKRVWYSF